LWKDANSWCTPNVDNGPSPYASGEPVRSSDDGRLVFSYRAVAGDTLIGVGERFCYPSAHLFYENDFHLDGFHPGVVIELRPGSGEFASNYRP
jgi:hypothetical protein